MARLVVVHVGVNAVKEVWPPAPWSVKGSGAVHHGEPWCTLLHYGALWCTMVHYVALWSTMVHY